MSVVPPAEPGLIDEQDPVSEARRLRVLFDGLPALIGYWDRDLRNVVANEAYVDWFGVSPEKMRGMHIREVVGDAVFDKNLPYMTRALAGEEQQFQRTLLDPSGRTRHSQVSYVPDVVDGEVCGLFVLVTDVTSRVEAERQLNEAQDLAELGSWSLVPSTNQIVWSAQMYRILGHDPETFVPEPESLILQVHPDDRDRVLATVTEARTSGVGYEQAFQIIRPDGQVREVLSRVRTEVAEGGEVTRLTGVTQDITSSNRLAREVGRVNEELQKVNQLNADVLGVVGHDVRGPLALVLGQLEVLTETWQESSPEANIARVEKSLGAARRLSVLLDDILAMANFDSGVIATRPRPVSLADVVSQALADVHGGVEVDVRRDGDPVGVVDPFHLRQMVANLVTNAVRYGAPPVVVTVRTAADSATIEVTDHGDGVQEAFVPYLFERFTRATDTTTPTRRPGSGFGLYVVRRLAEANRCRIAYERTETGGSCFRLLVPGTDPSAG
jgi:PAS domain S-box-containing protein